MKKLLAAAALILLLAGALMTRVEAGAGMSLPKDFSVERDSYVPNAVQELPVEAAASR